MSLQKIGNTLVASDKVLAIRPQDNAVEVVMQNGDCLMIPVPDPITAIDAYFSAATGATAPRST